MPDTSKTRLGNYELLEVLGDGAEGRVYKARCMTDRVPGVKVGDFVAVKRLRSTGFDRFQHQVEILRSLNHPNIVRYLDSFELHQKDLDEEGYCIVTELLVGETIKERLERNRTGLVWPTAQKIMTGTLNAILFSTSKRVVHRDIKSSNIYITGESESKLIDFGIARVEDTGASTVAGFKGTFDYMAPDFVTFQVEGGFRGDEQSDIFSFGVIFYEVLTGELPCEKLKGNVEIEHVKRWMDKLRPPRVKFHHPVFDVLIGARACLRKCLDPNRAARYQTFQDLQADFNGIRPKKLVDHNDVYEYVNYLGKGGFGKVFHARRLGDGKEVAIKELLADHQTRRFEKEAKILKELPHPGLVAYLGFVEIKEEDIASIRKFSLILEYLEGMPGNSLRDRIKATTTGMDPKEVLPIFIAYLDCLDYLHKKKIIHRDIKPANLYAPAGKPEKAKIFDLGIAHDTEGTRTHGQVPGTLDYMPPEFANPDLMKGQDGGRGSPQSDLFSLGVTLYQALTRQLPFDRFPTEEGAAWGAFYMRAEKPQDCSLNHPVFAQFPALGRVVCRCLAHDWRQRYASAREMARDLEKILRDIDIRMLECGGKLYRFGDHLAKETYRAVSQDDGAVVVIKQLTASTYQWRRFKSEAKILKDHPHPRLVAYICFDEDKGKSTPEISQFHLILEHLKGMPDASLRERIKKSPAGLEAKEVLPLFVGYLECLDYLHRMGMFHCGIKPSNLYAPVGEPQNAKVFDLGFAHDSEELRAHPPAPDSLDYMPPEFASQEGGRDSPQSDLYSLGVALHQALTGQLPFEPIPAGAAAAWTAFNLRVAKPRPCALSHPIFARFPDLAEVLRRCLAHEPSQRYISAQAMMGDLARVIRDIDLRMIQCDQEIYVFGECLFSSPFGATYRAVRRRDGLAVVIKEFTAGASHIDRFVDDAQMLQERPHPNLVKYIGFVEEEQVGLGGEESRCYLIQEFLEGLPEASLRDRLRVSKSGFDLDEVLSLFDGYLLCLEHLHSKRIFHRDIKPGHLYAPVGAPQLGKAFDLGISLGAKETATAEPKPGTLAYMAPEMWASGARYSPQADIYSLGLSLYEALTGQPPFPQPLEATPRPADWSKVSFAHPVFATARGQCVADVVRRAMAFDPQTRYVSAAAMRKALGAVPPPPRIALEVVEQIPKGPIKAGCEKFWVLVVELVGSNDFGNLSVTVTSRAPHLVPQANVQAKIEAGKVTVAALPLKTAAGQAMIEVSARLGTITSEPVSLTMEIEAIAPSLSIESTLPEGPVRAGREKIWTLAVGEVAANDMAGLFVTAMSHSPELVPQANVQAKVEEGKVVISAQPLRTVAGKATIAVSVRNGLATSQPIDLAMDIEAVPPWLTLERTLPDGPVRTGKEKLWVFALGGVAENEMANLAVTATSRSPDLLPQANIQAKVEEGKVKVTAQALKTAHAQARLDVSVRNGNLNSDPISLTMEIQHTFGDSFGVGSEFPEGPVKAGGEKLWVLVLDGVAENEMANLTVTATSRSPELIPQANVQAKVEEGKVKITARTLKTALGKAIIEVVVRSGTLTSNPISLTTEIEAALPSLTVERVVPEGPVRAGREQVWTLAVEGVAKSELATLSITATSHSPDLLPQANVEAKVEEGKVTIAAQSLRTAVGQATIHVSICSGLITGQPIVLPMEIEAFPPWLTVDRELPAGPVKAGAEKTWVLAVGGVAENELATLAVTATSRSPNLLPQTNVQAKVEEGKVKITAQSLRTADDKASIEVSVRSGARTSDPISLTMEIEAVPPSLKIERVLPEGPVRAGSEHIWILAVEGVAQNELANLSITATSRFPDLIPQTNVKATVEGGKVKIAVQPVRTAAGIARIDVSVRHKTLISQPISLTMDIGSALPSLTLEREVPEGTVKAGGEKLWVLTVNGVRGFEMGNLTVTTTLRTPDLFAEASVKAKVEDGKVKVTAQSRKTVAGKASIDVSIRSGILTSQPINLTMDIEAVAPSLSLELTVPIGAVKAGGEKLWVLAVEGVERNELGNLRVNAMSRTQDVIPQAKVRAKVEDGKVRVTAQPLETARGTATIEVAIRSGTVVSDPFTLTMEIEAPPPSLSIERATPEGPVKAGGEKSWVLAVDGVARNESANLAITIVSHSPMAVPTENVLSKIEDGKVRITAQSLKTASGQATIEVTVRNGTVAGKPISLTTQIEPAPPWLSVELERPDGPVRAGREKNWVLAVQGVAAVEMEVLTVTATSRSPDLVPQDHVAVKMEGSKVKIAAHSLKTVGGSATIEVSFSTRTIRGEPLSLKMDIESIPPPRVQLLTPTPLLLAPKEESLLLDFEVADEDVPAKALNFLLKIDPPDLVTFEAPAVTGTPKRSLRLHRARSRRGRGEIEVTVQAEGRSCKSRFEFEVARPPMPKWPFVAGLLLVMLAGAWAFMATRPSLSVSPEKQVVEPGKIVEWIVQSSHTHGQPNIEIVNTNALVDGKANFQTNNDGSIRITATALDDLPTNATVQIMAAAGGTDLNRTASAEIKANPIKIEVVSNPPVLNNDKDAVIVLQVTPSHDADKVLPESTDTNVGVMIERGTAGIVNLKVNRVNLPFYGSVKINAVITNPPTTNVLTAEFRLPKSTIKLLTPEPVGLATNQESTELKFSVSDEDTNLTPESLKVDVVSVEPPNIVTYGSSSLSGGATRTLTLTRGPAFPDRTVTITVQVTAGERTYTTNFTLQVEPVPSSIELAASAIAIPHNQDSTNISVVISDPYMPSEKLEPTLLVDPPNILTHNLSQDGGSNWTIHLARNPSAQTDSSATVTLRVKGKGAPVSKSFSVNVQTNWMSAASLVSQSDAHTNVNVRKRSDPPLKILCRLAGSGYIVKRKHSNHPILLPDDEINFDPHPVQGGDGVITLAPRPGQRGDAHVDIDITADNATESLISIDLNVAGDLSRPVLVVLPGKTNIDKGHKAELQFGLTNDYFESDKLSASVSEMNPPDIVAKPEFPRPLTDSFQVALIALKPGDVKITFQVTDLNKMSDTKQVEVHVPTPIEIPRPSNVTMASDKATNRVWVTDDQVELERMSGADIHVTSAKHLFKANPSLPLENKRLGSNAVDLIISPQGPGGGQDTLEVTATDSSGRKATNSFTCSFVPPFTSLLQVPPPPNAFPLTLIWVPGLPGTEGQTWQPAGSEPLNGGGWVAMYKVTQEQFQQVLGSNPSKHKNRLRDPIFNRPVENMLFKDAMAFCDELYKIDQAKIPQGWRYALPSVKQWAFYATGTPATSDYAYYGQPKLEPLAVGSKWPNRYSLYDVLGDVYELTRDPAKVGKIDEHIRRGGSFFIGDDTCLSTNINIPIEDIQGGYPDTPSGYGPDTGFRVILVPDSAAQ